MVNCVVFLVSRFIMTEDLMKDWEKFRLTEEEEIVIGGHLTEADDLSKTQISLTLMGKLLTNKLLILKQ